MNPNLLRKLQKDTGTFSPTSSRESLSQFLAPHPFPMMFKMLFISDQLTIPFICLYSQLLSPSSPHLAFV